MIARRLFLLETVFLLFIDDDEPDIFQRGKHRGARPHNDARFAIPHSPPFAGAFHIAQRRMQHRHALESRPKPRPALPPDPKCQRNFRHQNKCGFSTRKRILHRAQIHFRLSTARHAVEQLYAEFAELKSRANHFQRALLLRVQFVRGRRVPRIEGILRRIDWLFPALQQPVAQHSLDHRTGYLRQVQKLWHRQRPAFRFQQFANAFFPAIPLRVPCFRVIFFFFFLCRRSVSHGMLALPGDHVLRPSVSCSNCLPNFDEAEALQPLQRGSVNAQLWRGTERHGSFLFVQLRKKRRLSGLESVRQLSAAQAVRRFTPRICQHNLALRFQLRHRRQHRAKNLAYRGQVVARDPVRQLDQLRRQRRYKIQHAGDLANFRFLRRALRKFHNDSDHRFFAEGDEYAAARLHRSLQCCRNRIRERHTQRHRQRDIAKW